MAELAQARDDAPGAAQSGAAKTGLGRVLSNPYLTLISRLVLGAIFFLAGLTKLGEPESFATSIRAYEMPIPEFIVQAMAYVMPPLEVGLGICLLLGLFTKWAGAISGGLMVIFLVALVQGWVRDLNIVCGCFASGPDANPLGSALVNALGPIGTFLTNEKAGAETVIRDVILALMGLNLFLVPTVFGLDNWLKNRYAEDPAEEGAGG